MFKKIFTAEGDIVPIRPDNTNKYRITVDKSTLLPIEVVQSNDKNDETVTTTYAELTEKPSDPVTDTWFFSTYLNEYALQRKDKLVPIEAGKPAPEFSLARYEAAEKDSLGQHSGKLILIEFWIAQCGFCIAAVPRLNDISHRYRDKGLAVVSVNMYDPAGTIEFFKRKNKPEYTILTDGDSIARSYGIDAYPAFVLVGVDGKVVYSSSGLQEKELEAAITAAVQR
jgi:thiol-disulfide isomerase/thioredoxin